MSRGGRPSARARMTLQINTTMSETKTDDKRLLTALGHDDFFLRSTALHLLADMPKPGIEATRAAIAAIEKHGHRKAFEYPHQFGSLPHDADSLAWAAGYCSSINRSAPDDTLPSHLALWIAKAPTELLADWEVPAVPSFGSRDPVGIARRRLELASASAEECFALIDEGVGEIAKIIYLYRTLGGEDSSELRNWRAELERKYRRTLDSQKNFDAKFARLLEGGRCQYWLRNRRSAGTPPVPAAAERSTRSAA